MRQTTRTRGVAWLAALLICGTARASDGGNGAAGPFPACDPAVDPIQAVGRGAGLQRKDAQAGVQYSASFDGAGRVVVTARAEGFTYEKVLSVTGELQIRVRAGNDSVSIGYDAQGVTVSRGRASVTAQHAGPDEQSAANLRRVIGGSRAVRWLRLLTAQLEALQPEQDDFFAQSMLIDGAIVGALDGDPGAIRRIAGRAAARHRARQQHVRLLRVGQRFDDCVGRYEDTVSWAWDEMIQCNQDASDDPWYLRGVNMSLCNAEWVMRSQSALYQFFACSALPI